ncbi:hypothetical protein L6654_08520 [Bradyrhizobium sp. WYCCWR 13023]|uniref:Uncharacterized protein n=1 Tax=Bradyrhizobium zhengyangense TaxID=2911009 RepID=A0A9X1R9F4_9BRAD|nr:hypothetical protein [Bradyrhizobium zhengyangense]MCG2626664.1 hypothetical protein [Bradyrhizobium zhengyangense]
MSTEIITRGGARKGLPDVRKSKNLPMEAQTVRYAVIYERAKTGRFTVLDMTTHEPATLGPNRRTLTALSHSTADILAAKMNANEPLDTS